MLNGRASLTVALASLLFALAILSARVLAAPEQGTKVAEGKPKAEFPPFESVVKGLTKVVSTADGSPPLYDLY